MLGVPAHSSQVSEGKQSDLVANLWTDALAAIAPMANKYNKQPLGGLWGFFSLESEMKSMDLSMKHSSVHPAATKKGKRGEERQS